MDYGKKNSNKTLSNLKKKKPKRKKKYNAHFWKSFLIGLLIFILVVILAFGVYAATLINKLPDIKDVNISPNGYSTTVLDKDGNEIESLAASGSNRQYVELKDIPEDVQHAFVAIEDERFYKHNGIDVRGIIRAGFTTVFTLGRNSQGASTITQQLLKNNYFTQWTDENSFMDRFNRKIQEQYLAVELEKVTDKDTILENYLNTINLGQNTLGVEAASERYFNKSVSDLSLSEAAVIAAITQNPTKYNPISNPDENAKRREKVLKNMQKQGYITKDQMNEALDDNVYDRISSINTTSYSTSSTSYFVDALTDQVVDDLVEQKGYTEAEAYQKLYSGGLTIKSTEDANIQNILEEEANNTDNYSGATKYSISFRLTIEKADGTTKNYSETTMLSYYQSSNSGYSINYSSKEAAEEAYKAYKDAMMESGDTIPDGGESVEYTLQPQVSLTVMDQSTGAVVGLVGGRGEKNGSKTLNRATGITRQPGSTFKILTAYAAALDAGGLTLASVQDDTPTTYANGTALHNYDSTYRGFTNIRTGITYSINVVAVKTLTEIGTGLGFEYAQNLGISTLESGDNNQALALGGITNGVTNLELCGAYATIANGGQYNKPVFYTEVLDNQGQVLLTTEDNESKEVLKDSTAWLLTSAMKDVMTTGTGSPANFDGQAVAGKSGTTTKDRDTLFAGFTPYYTCVIWGGYDDNTPQSSVAYSKAIWKACMSRIHSGLAYKDFTMPSDIVQVKVCSKSGKLPIKGVCNHDPRGSMVYTEYFAKGTEPTETCDHHTKVTVCKDTGKVATEYCPRTKSTVYIIGGSEGNADSDYLYNENGKIKYCTKHTAKTAKKDDANKEDSDDEDSSDSTDDTDGTNDSTEEDE